MEVLVGRDADHDLVGDRVVGVAAGVAVRDPRGELLERDVGEAAERRRRLVVVALLELGHPAALEGDRVDVPGDREVVAEDDRVTTLLGRPAADPVDPGAVALAEHPVDEAVVAGQVVLGQQADLERGLGDPGQARLVGRPWLLVEVAPEPVRDEVVGEPLLGDLRVPVVEAGGLGLELVEQRAVVVAGDGRREGEAGWNCRAWGGGPHSQKGRGRPQRTRIHRPVSLKGSGSPESAEAALMQKIGVSIRSRD